jgi:hypothetical protein
MWLNIGLDTSSGIRGGVMECGPEKGLFAMGGGRRKMSQVTIGKCS